MSTCACDSFSVARASSHAALPLERDMGSVGRREGQLVGGKRTCPAGRRLTCPGAPAASPTSGNGWRKGAERRAPGWHECEEERAL